MRVNINKSKPPLFSLPAPGYGGPSRGGPRSRAAASSTASASSGDRSIKPSSFRH